MRTSCSNGENSKDDISQASKVVADSVHLDCPEYDVANSVLNAFRN